MGSNRRFCVRTPPGAPNGSGRITARQFLECSKNTPFSGSRQAMLVIFLHFAIPIGSWFAVPSAHAHAPSPPTPTPFLRFLVWAGPVCCPALSRQNILREKKEGRKPSSRSSHPILCTSPGTRTVLPVLSSQQQQSEQTDDTTRPPTPWTKVGPPQLCPLLRNRVSLPPLTAHATSPGLTVKSRRPGPML